MGCSSSTNSERVVRISPTDIIDTDPEYGVEDLNLFVHKMINSLLQNSFSDELPTITFGEIRIGNGVNEHIDTKLISNKIRTNLIKTKKVKVKNSNTLKNIDYQLTGDIHAIKKENHKGIDNFYALNLILTNLKTSTIVWSEETEVRKLVKR